MWQELATEHNLDCHETWGHTQDWLDLSLVVKCRKTCRQCRKQITSGWHEYIDAPKIIVLTLEDVPQAIIDPFVKISTGEQGFQKLDLSGIIYFGQEHFTARIIDNSQQVWYHDGLVTRRSCTPNGQLEQLSSQDLWTKEGRNASTIIYSAQ